MAAPFRTTFKEQERHWKDLVKRHPNYELGDRVLPSGLTLPPGGALGPPPGALSAAGIHYILEGPAKGPLVVCVPGLGDFSYRFTLMAAALVSSGFRVLRLDMPGRGWSVAPKDFAFDAAAHVGVVKGLLAELSLTPAVIVAHSMGCIVANLLVAELQSVKALVLMSPAGMMASPIPGFAALQALMSTWFGRRVLLPAMGPYPPKRAPPPGWYGDWVLRGEEDAAAETLQLWDLQWMNASRVNGQRPFFYSVARMPMTSLSRHLRPVDAKKRGLRVLLLTAEHDGAVKNVDTAFYERIYGAESVQVEPPRPAMAHVFFVQEAEAMHKRILGFLGEGKY